MIRLLIFLYDMARLGVFLLMIRLTNTDANISDLFLFPLSAYAAPLALFPIMTFFLWQDSEKYHPFASLYAAGKIINCCAMIVPFAIWLKTAFVSIPFWTNSKLLFNVLVPILILLDVLSVLIIRRKKV
ncbi:MAG: hypothetical protein Ta2G_06380 [Termitinemataceae bacterium]|nr:MAG: hypothetical protein Ta2G_06380 [Termitinemataceae bacterium]